MCTTCQVVPGVKHLRALGYSHLVNAKVFPNMIPRSDHVIVVHHIRTTKTTLLIVGECHARLMTASLLQCNFYWALMRGSAKNVGDVC